MSVWRRTARIALNLISKARRLAPVAAVYARLPSAWKLRTTRRLLRTAIGSDPSRTVATGLPTFPVSESLPPRHIDPRHAGQGVNLYGYVRGEFGLGESVRGFAKALARSGFPFALMDFEVSTPGRAEDHSLDSWVVDEPEHNSSLYFINPDQMLRARAHFEMQRKAGRCVIGYWFWELERFPDTWRDAFRFVDEVWVASEFVRRSIAAASDKPVRLMPMPLDYPTPAAVERQRFGVPDDRFVFLFTFDYHSYPLRKNPEAVIAAFRTAFPRDRDDVCLLVKTLNADRLPDVHLRLLDATGSDPRIIVSDGHLSRTDVSSLIACSDAYVSLHRSEGLGLGMAEAMALGKPVVATGYSGNMDFMTADNACLVDFRLVDLPPNAYPHWQDQRWAEPDIAHAARQMRMLADDPAGARTLGAAAKARIRRQYDPSACASAVIERLRIVAAGRLAMACAQGTSKP